MEESFILVVDDDEATLGIIRSILLKLNLNLTFANNGKQALELINKYNFSVLITDLSMPIMNGVELLESLISKDPKPTPIILTNNNSIEDAVKLMKLGAFDYLVKPIQSEKLISTVMAALEYHNLELAKKNLEKENQIFLLKNLEWETYRRKTQRQLYLKNKFQILENIRTSFSQGAGFGALESLIQRIQKKTKKEEDFYKVPSALMDLLFENAEATHRILDFFNFIEELNTLETFEKMNLSEIHSLIVELAHNVNLGYSKIKNQRIIVSQNKSLGSEKFINIKKSYFEKLVTELFMNSFKFSIPNSSVYIITSVSEGKLELAFLNSPEASQNGIVGIPEEYSELVFEPFFRMSKFVYEAYPTMDFGLGLTLVEKIVQKFGGKISARNIKSYLPNSTHLLTLIQIEFEII